MSKMNKNIVPEGFTISMALIDGLPVLFFALMGIFLGIMLNSILFVVGAGVCFISGALKVLWKIIVVLKRKNVWPLFLQMRIVMPIGFLVIIVSFILACVNKSIKNLECIINAWSFIFLGIGIIGMILMIIFSIKLDSSNPKANWIEQICNSICQGSFFLAILIAFLLR